MTYRSKFDGGLHGETSLNRLRCANAVFFVFSLAKSTHSGGMSVQILSREIPRVRTRAGLRYIVRTPHSGPEAESANPEETGRSR